MSKFWTPGQVKTRLAATIGDPLAADLHRLFVRHLCRELSAAGDRREVVVWPPARRADMSKDLPPSWTTCEQTAGDLGARMSHWFAHVAPGPTRAILIGADCPTLRPCDLDAAWEALNANDVVLGPAGDGGYYLIGLRGPWRSSFQSLFRQMPWSTDGVVAITLARINQAALTLHRLDERDDVDTIDDLRRLQRQLQQVDAPEPAERRLRTAIERIMGGHTGAFHSTEPAP